MDGASKFVKGDAVAAIIIMMVNIIGGFVIGVVQRGLPLTTALQTYVLLTIGAGLAVQVPSLLVSAAAGLIVTRSTSETSLGNEVSNQISNFNVLAVGAAIVALMGLVPGLPKIPFAIVSIGLGVGAVVVHRTQTEAIARETVAALPALPTEPETPEQMLEMVVVDPIELEIGYSLIAMIDEDSQDNLLRRITGIRRQLMSELGLILPVVRIRDNLRLTPQAYRIKIRGQEVASGEIALDRLLAIPGSDSEENLPGTPTTEPAFGLPALWIHEFGPEPGRAQRLHGSHAAFGPVHTSDRDRQIFRLRIAQPPTRPGNVEPAPPEGACLRGRRGSGAAQPGRDPGRIAQSTARAHPDP